MDTRSLNAFLISVPTCVETDSLRCVWRTFRQAGCDQVVIVDAQHIPLGILTLSQLLCHFSAHPSIAELPAALSDIDSDISLQVLLQRDHTLLVPLTLLSFHDSLEPLPSLEQAWGLVDSQGHFLGLVDRLRFLQSFVPATFQPVSPGFPLPPVSPALLPPLIDLLERLPLPLMLQTGTGQVITQNLVWRQQIDELQNSAQVQQSAAVMLQAVLAETAGIEALQKAPQAVTRSASEAAASLPDPQGLQAAKRAEAPSPAAQANDLLFESCRLSPEPNTCICTCLLKTGQSRVWQFTKIPMGYGGTEEPGIWATPDQPSREERSGSTAFQLATLGFQPDPEWQTLIQTESLWLVLAQDVTEQQQVAKELAAKNADLVQLNRLKDEFLACISHELKSPLTAVLGLSSLLKDQALGTLNERQARYANLIHQSGRHLILIVNDILDLTRIETGQLALNLAPIKIKTICDRAYEQASQLQAMESSAKAEGNATAIDLQFNLEIQPPLDYLIADELRLRQMLSNLLCNAIKFTEVGGSIGLRVEDWEGWIAFTVWDTGLGIPEDKQHLIFQKFQQLENPLTRRFDGTGLGLVLTQRLARLHGGDVTFTSVEGQGSEFTLLLPPRPPQALTAGNARFAAPLETAQQVISATRSPERSAVPPASTSATPPIAPTRITADNRLVMVVESAPAAIESLSRQLTSLGYRVAIARAGTEALEKIRRLQPCVIFLNPMLPMLSGWDVLTLLKADTATRQIPVVVTAMRVEKSQAYQNGADGFLSLPTQIMALEQTLERLVAPPVSETPDPLSSLTVLHLRGQLPDSATSREAVPLHLTQLLYPHQCRILEVDDVEQAELLTRVWKPDVVLLDGHFPDLQALMARLSKLPFVAELPLVTLTPMLTEAALEEPNLKVFPWTTSDRPHSEAATLQQVIQLAVGIDWMPHILIADFTTLEEDWTEVDAAGTKIPSSSAAGGLQALVQYIHTAGFRSSVGTAWQDVLGQLQHQSVDLLLFYVHTFESHALFAEMTQALEQLPVKPPILVWHCNAYAVEDPSPAEIREFETMWGGAIATQVLPACLSMTELLAEIHRLLPKKR
jgi:signal transduction histidine kinase/CheY-like chemotaxis protein